MAQVYVLFEVSVAPGRMDSYLSKAAELKERLKDVPGFIRAERFSSLAREGRLLSMSVWESEECVQNWRMLEAHRAAQASGRSDDFLDYEITVLNPVRRYSMSARDSAPQDSNEALGV